MKPGKDTLWSTDLSIPRVPADSAALGRSLPGAPEPALPRQPGPPDPLRERAYLRYGVPALQAILASGGMARLHTVSDTLAERVPDFDYDDLRRAMRELGERGAVAIREPDNRRGDHLYGITDTGRLLAG